MRTESEQSAMEWAEGLNAGLLASRQKYNDVKTLAALVLRLDGELAFSKRMCNENYTRAEKAEAALSDAKAQAERLLADVTYVAEECEAVARSEAIPRAESRTWRVTARLLREALAKAAALRGEKR